MTLKTLYWSAGTADNIHVGLLFVVVTVCIFCKHGKTINVNRFNLPLHDFYSLPIQYYFILLNIYVLNIFAHFVSYNVCRTMIRPTCIVHHCKHKFIHSCTICIVSIGMYFEVIYMHTLCIHVHCMCICLHLLQLAMCSFECQQHYFWKNVKSKVYKFPVYIT